MPDAVATGRRGSLLGRRDWQGALPLWLGSRVAVVLTGLTVVRLVRPPGAAEVPGLLDSWYHWDVALFIKVARFGYLSPAYRDRTEVDFPGLPLLLRLLHAVDGSWLASGLLISLVAGGFASCALWRLAEDEAPGSGRVALAAMVLYPYSVFLFAGYSESLFLGFALPAWLAARRGRWPLAVVLGAGAAATRVTGIALAVALAVEYLWRRPAGVRLWSRAGARSLLRPTTALLVVPALPAAGYAAYLHARTGHWDAYPRAMREGWGRAFSTPWQAWSTTWAQAANPHQGADYQWYWRAELCAAFVGLLLTVLLLARRRWGEATFVGVSLLLFTSTTYFASGIRASLLWFPLYLLAGRALRGRPQAQLGLACVAFPLALVVTAAFVTGSWLD